MRTVTRGDNIRHGHAQPGLRHQHPLPTPAVGAHRTALSSWCTHPRSIRAAWRLSPADAKLQAPGGIRYTLRARRRCSPHRHLCGSRSVRQDEARLCAPSCSGAHLVAAVSVEYAESDSRTLLTRLGDEGYPSLEGAECSVHCMVRCRRPASLALSSSSCLGTRWPRANRTVCQNTFRDRLLCDHHAV
jgi:hypothetical protein